jgi:F-type H+-transporting ATPase subunit delta
MNVSLVAKRYANALFDLAIEQHLVEEVYADSKLIVKAARESRELRFFLKSPIINSEKKLHIIRAIFENKVHQMTLTYLEIMVRKHRESFIPEIARELKEVYQAYKNILVVQFKSPVLPDAAVTAEVNRLMARYTGATIELEPSVDEELIGGFVLTWKDKQYDASIRREIDDMRKAIAKLNLYVKGF